MHDCLLLYIAFSPTKNLRSKRTLAAHVCNRYKKHEVVDTLTSRNDEMIMERPYQNTSFTDTVETMIKRVELFFNGLVYDIIYVKFNISFPVERM